MSLEIKVQVLGCQGISWSKTLEGLASESCGFQLTESSQEADVLLLLPGHPASYGREGGKPAVCYQEHWAQHPSLLHEALKKAFCSTVPRSECCSDSGPSGSGTVWEAVLKGAALVADHMVPLLITGETGVGKDVLARKVHELSKRAQGPFVALNCGAIPATLVESELWGCDKGAFTDAVPRRGLFEQAQGGTLFLDEVGELPMDVQVKLLRVLEEKQLKRVGGQKSIPLDFRLVSATNRDLKKEVREGRFRMDLFYRLEVLVLTIPPLRHRLGEIPGLVSSFLSQRSRCRLSPEALRLLESHHWPGNIRELRNVVERASVLAGQGEILPQHIRFDGLLDFPDTPSLKN